MHIYRAATSGPFLYYSSFQNRLELVFNRFDTMNISLLAIAILLVLVFYKYFLHSLLLSPLSKIPNAHSTSPFSPFWILWVRYTRVENRVVHDAHQRLGPVIRLGPNEISVNQVNGGIRTVYSGGFDKPEWCKPYSCQPVLYRNKVDVAFIQTLDSSRTMGK